MTTNFSGSGSTKRYPSRSTRSQQVLELCDNGERSKMWVTPYTHEIAMKKNLKVLFDITGAEEHRDLPMYIHDDPETLSAFQNRINISNNGQASFIAGHDSPQPLWPRDQVVFSSEGLKKSSLKAETIDRYPSGQQFKICCDCSSGASQNDPSCNACTCSSNQVECYHLRECSNTSIRHGGIAGTYICHTRDPRYGLGVRSITKIKQDSCLGLFSGEIRLASKPKSNYSFQFPTKENLFAKRTPNLIIDPVPYGWTTSLINDPGNEHGNVEIRFIESCHFIYPAIFAIKNIDENDWIYLPYGADYYVGLPFERSTPTEPNDKDIGIKKLDSRPGRGEVIWQCLRPIVTNVQELRSAAADAAPTAAPPLPAAGVPEESRPVAVVALRPATVQRAVEAVSSPNSHNNNYQFLRVVMGGERTIFVIVNVQSVNNERNTSEVILVGFEGNRGLVVNNSDLFPSRESILLHDSQPIMMRPQDTRGIPENLLSGCVHRARDINTILEFIQIPHIRDRPYAITAAPDFNRYSNPIPRNNAPPPPPPPPPTTTTTRAAPTAPTTTTRGAPTAATTTTTRAAPTAATTNAAAPCTSTSQSTSTAFAATGQSTSTGQRTLTAPPPTRSLTGTIIISDDDDDDDNMTIDLSSDEEQNARHNIPGILAVITLDGDSDEDNGKSAQQQRNVWTNEIITIDDDDESQQQQQQQQQQRRRRQDPTPSTSSKKSQSLNVRNPNASSLSLDSLKLILPFFQSPEEYLKKRSTKNQKFYVGQRTLNLQCLWKASEEIFHVMEKPCNMNEKKSYKGPIVANEYVYRLSRNLRDGLTYMPPTCQGIRQLFNVNHGGNFKFWNEKQFERFHSIFSDFNTWKIEEDKWEEFHFQNHLQRHQQQQDQHENNIVIPFECFSCPEIGELNENTVIKNHIKQHLDQKGVICTCCAKRFTTADELNAHKNASLDEKDGGGGNFLPHANEVYTIVDHPHNRFNDDTSTFSLNLFGSLMNEVERYNRKAWEYNKGQRTLSIRTVKKAVKDVLNFLSNNIFLVPASEMILIVFLKMISAHLKTHGIPIMPPESKEYLEKRHHLFTTGDGTGFKFYDFEDYLSFIKIFQSKYHIDEVNRTSATTNKTTGFEYCMLCNTTITNGTLDDIKNHAMMYNDEENHGHIEKVGINHCIQCGYPVYCCMSIQHSRRLHQNQLEWSEKIWRREGDIDELAHHMHYQA